MNQTLYAKPIHPYAYRKNGTLPKVLGKVPYKPENFKERLCYKVQYEDGEIDYIAVSSVELGHVELTTDKYDIPVSIGKLN